MAGFAPDPNPNVTVPAAGTTFVMQNQPSDQLKDERVEGHRICIRFVDNTNAEVVGPTADFRTWVKDEGASDFVAKGGLGRSAWVCLKAEAAAESGSSYAGSLKGELFVQLTGLASVGVATKVQVWADESTSVPG